MATAYNPGIVTSGLVLCLDAGNAKSYPGSGTTWTDLSGNSNTGTLVGGAAFNSGNSGNIVFDGTDDYVSIADSTTTNTFSALTLEVVAKYTSTANQILAQKWNYGIGAGYGIEVFSNAIYGYCTAAGNSYAVVSISAYPANNIYYFTLTMSGGIQTLYINGNQVASVSGGGFPNYGGYDFRLGGRSSSGGGNSSKLTGNVYLSKLYNVALTAAEVLQNYNALRGRFGL